MKIELPQSLRAFIQAEAVTADERCGLLLGQVVNGRAVIDEARAAPNVSQTPADSFEIDPATRLKAQRRVRAEGRAVLGLYHTHPNGTVAASTRDHAGAKDELNLIWVIATAEDIAAYLASEEGLTSISL